MKYDFSGKENSSTKKFIFALLMLFFFSYSLKAQKYYSHRLSDEELLSIGSTYYASNKFKHSAIYMYAYLQRNPSLLNENEIFRNELYEALNFSLVNMNKENSNDVVGVESKQDGEDLMPISQPADFYKRTTKPNFPKAGSTGKNQSIQITGYWVGNDSGTYYIRQLGNEVWWYGQSSDSGKTWANVFHGTIDGNKISGKWSDVPLGKTFGSGKMVIQVLDPKHLKVLTKTGSFSGSEWHATTPIKYKNSMGSQ